MAVALMPRGVAPVLVVVAVGLSAQGGFAREASPLGTMNLGAGSHRLRCEAVSKNVDSQNYRFGLDCIELVGEHDAK